MANLKSLVKDTAIYGLSSIVGRFLNYLLVPLYTRVIEAADGGYGVVNNVYAYTALLLVILTFGMETTFFRFANKEEENPHTVFSTALGMVSFLCVLFAGGVLLFIDPISAGMGYADHPEYIQIMAICVALDAFKCIPFAWLRFQKRPIKFATLQLLNIAVNIGLNLLYFVAFPAIEKEHPGMLGLIYDPTIGTVDYIFILNLVCTVIVTLCFCPDLLHIKWHFDFALLRRMFSYSWPILVFGIAGNLTNFADRIIYPFVVPDGWQEPLGIYGACVKIAMIMTMITQAFRYAYEPFVFAANKEKDSKQAYATTMKFFIIFTLLAFLCVMGYMDILQRIVGNTYREGMRVVPIVMAAEIMMGIYFNLSFWYKLIDKTIWGMWLSMAGCLTLIIVDVVFIPIYGYIACAWGCFAGYFVSMVFSYFAGQHHNPIAYPLKSIFVYIALAAILYGVMAFLPADWPTAARLGINTLLILAFVAHILYHDLPLRSLPVVGRFFRK